MYNIHPKQAPLNIVNTNPLFREAQDIIEKYEVLDLAIYHSGYSVNGFESALRVQVPRVNAPRLSIEYMKHPLLTELRRAFPHNKRHDRKRLFIQDLSLGYERHKTLLIRLGY